MTKPTKNQKWANGGPGGGEALVTAIRRHLLQWSQPHTAADIATALDAHVSTVREKLATLATKGDAVNVNPGVRPAKYQHHEHHSRENHINRRAPIRNSGMPTGDQAFWAAHMAAFNAPPRGR